MQYTELKEIEKNILDNILGTISLQSNIIHFKNIIFSKGLDSVMFGTYKMYILFEMNGNEYKIEQNNISLLDEFQNIYTSETYNVPYENNNIKKIITDALSKKICEILLNNISLVGDKELIRLKKIS